MLVEFTEEETGRGCEILLGLTVRASFPLSDCRTGKEPSRFPGARLPVCTVDTGSGTFSTTDRWLALLLQLLEWPLWWSGRRVTPLGPRNFRGICPWLLFSVDRRCPDKKREGSFVEEKLNEMVIWKAPRGVRNEMEGVVSTGDRRTASFSVD